MPLAAHAALVPLPCQQLGKIFEFPDCAVRVRPHLSIRLLFPKPPVNAVLRGHEAGQYGRTIRRTNRIRTECIREADTVLCKSIDIRRKYLVVAVAAQRPRTLVVRHHKEQVRILISCHIPIHSKEQRSKRLCHPAERRENPRLSYEKSRRLADRARQWRKT